ncbi:MAG: PIN domain-containing protein [Rickettsiales bacterium]|jgi:predicted nucleic acid-binding protein|nr:PIN domain-containing protein [Rickettsiales bacterium]
MNCVVFDTSILTYVFKASLEDKIIREKVDLLLKKLEKKGVKIVIPTPVLTEILQLIGTDGESIEKITKNSQFKIAPFDYKASVECAILCKEINKDNDKIGQKQKLKFDMQIVAIAKSIGCSIIYSNDEHIFKRCKDLGIKVVGINDLEL